MRTKNRTKPAIESTVLQQAQCDEVSDPLNSPVLGSTVSKYMMVPAGPSPSWDVLQSQPKRPRLKSVKKDFRYLNR